MSIASLEDLCIFNSLGSQYLSQSIRLSSKAAEDMSSDPLPAIANIHPCSRLLTKDLIDKIKPLQRVFQKSMESQAYFIDIIEKYPKLALFSVRKYSAIFYSFIENNKELCLCGAARSGDSELVSYLIKKFHANVNAADDFGHTVFHCAAKSGSLALVRYLNETFDLNVNALTYDGDTVLHFAARSGNLELVLYLIETFHLDVIGAIHEDDTILHYAARSGNLALVRYLIETFYPGVNAITHGGDRVLRLAVLSGNLELVRYLIEDLGLDGGDTVLHPAAESGNLALFRYLIEDRGLDVHGGGKALLSTAAQSGNLALVRYLIETCYLKTKVSESVVFYAKLSGNTELIQYLLPLVQKTSICCRVTQVFTVLSVFVALIALVTSHERNIR